jgi:hypothetical protein
MSTGVLESKRFRFAWLARRQRGVERGMILVDVDEAFGVTNYGQNTRASDLSAREFERGADFTRDTAPFKNAFPNWMSPKCTIQSIPDLHIDTIKVKSRNFRQTETPGPVKRDVLLWSWPRPTLSSQAGRS